MRVDALFGSVLAGARLRCACGLGGKGAYQDVAGGQRAGVEPRAGARRLHGRRAASAGLLCAGGVGGATSGGGPCEAVVAGGDGLGVGLMRASHPWYSFSDVQPLVARRQRRWPPSSPSALSGSTPGASHDLHTNPSHIGSSTSCCQPPTLARLCGTAYCARSAASEAREKSIIENCS